MKEKKKRARCTPKKIRFSRPDLKIIDTDGDQITLKRVRWRIPRAKISRSPLQIFFLVIIALLIIGYLLQRIMFKLYPKIEEQRQLFGYEKLRIDLMDGTDPNGTGERCEIYNCFKKTRAGRYATDCFSDILAKRSLNSSWELDLSDTYSSATATPEELRQQHSYFGAKILNIGRESDHDGTGSS